MENGSGVCLHQNYNYSTKGLFGFPNRKQFFRSPIPTWCPKFNSVLILTAQNFHTSHKLGAQSHKPSPFRYQLEMKTSNYLHLCLLPIKGFPWLLRFDISLEQLKQFSKVLTLPWMFPCKEYHSGRTKGESVGFRRVSRTSVLSPSANLLPHQCIH